MKKVALTLAASLALGGSAFAAERAPEKTRHECVTVAKIKNDLKEVKGLQLTPLNISQYHFMMGVYAATPPVGLPANTDNALLAQIKGKQPLIIWMEAECASETPPTQISDKLIGMLRTIAPVAGEASDSPDSSEERKL